MKWFHEIVWSLGIVATGLQIVALVKGDRLAVLTFSLLWVSIFVLCVMEWRMIWKEEGQQKELTS